MFVLGIGSTGLNRKGLKLSTLVLACGLVAGGPAVARAQAPAASAAPSASTATVKVGGTIFTDFTYADSPLATDADGNAVHASAFDVSRAYINVTGTVTRLVAFRITPDVKRLLTTSKGLGSGQTVATTLDGSEVFRLKYAYGQVNLDDVLPKGSWVRIGVHQTPFLDFIEGIYRYRFQGTLAVEREGFLSSSDFGISGRVALPRNFGDVQLGVYNGETYAKGEANDRKSFQIRASVRPLPEGSVLKGLRLTAFYLADQYLKSGPRNRFVGAATFEHPRLNVGLEYLQAEDRPSASAPTVRADGYSVWVEPRTRFGLEGFFRRDDFRPSKSQDASKVRTIVGAAYWLKTQAQPFAAAVLGDFEHVKYDRSLGKPVEKRLSLHCLLAF